MRLTSYRWMVYLSAAFAFIGGAAAQEFPNKPVRMITSAVGGSGDFHARLLAPGLTGSLRQPVIVENRGGGTGAQLTAAKATPDGYTLLIDSHALWITTLLQKTGYDPIKDFTPVSTLSRSPYVLVVHPSLQVTTVKDLINLAKAKPGQLNYSSGEPGNTSHLAAELLKFIGGVNIVGVPYASNSQEITDVLSGRVQLTFWPGSRAIPLAKDGKVRMVGVTSTAPSLLFPGIPPLADSGLPGYEWGQVIVMMAPAKTPNAIIQQLNREIARALNQPDTKQKFLDSGIEPATSSPAELAAFITSSMDKMDKVIKTAGIRVEK